MQTLCQLYIPFQVSDLLGNITVQYSYKLLRRMIPMSNNFNSKKTVQIPMDKQVQVAEFKKNFLTERQRLEQELNKPYVKDVTTEKVEAALNTLAETPQEQIKYLNLGEQLTEYVEYNKELTVRVNRMLDDTAKTMATLTAEANKRSADMLTPIKLKKLLNSDLRFNVINRNEDTFQKIETEFDFFVERVAKKLNETVTALENRFNLSIVLQVVTIILVLIF